MNLHGMQEPNTSISSLCFGFGDHLVVFCLFGEGRFFCNQPLRPKFISFSFVEGLGNSWSQIVHQSILDCRWSTVQFTLLCISPGELQRRDFEKTIPIHSSKIKTSFSSIQKSFSVCSEALSMLILVCLMIST